MSVNTNLLFIQTQSSKPKKEKKNTAHFAKQYTSHSIHHVWSLFRIVNCTLMLFCKSLTRAVPRLIARRSYQFWTIFCAYNRLILQLNSLHITSMYYRREIINKFLVGNQNSRFERSFVASPRIELSWQFLHIRLIFGSR